MYLWSPGTGDPPLEYILFRLRQDVYHCTPSQLDDEDWDRILDDLAIWKGIAKANK